MTEKYCTVWIDNVPKELTKEEYINLDDSIVLSNNNGPIVESHVDGHKTYVSFGRKIAWSTRKKGGILWATEDRGLFNPEEAKEISRWVRQNKIDLFTEEGVMAFLLRWA